MTQYLLAVHQVQDEAPPSSEQIKQMYANVDVFNKDLMQKGMWVFGGGLQPPNIATVVRSESGETTLTDGPFAESKEQLGGIWIIEAPDLDVALEYAAKGSAACGLSVEVRPFQQMPA